MFSTIWSKLVQVANTRTYWRSVETILSELGRAISTRRLYRDWHTKTYQIKYKNKTRYSYEYVTIFCCFWMYFFTNHEKASVDPIGPDPNPDPTLG